MKARTKITRSLKAVSKVISVLLMIAIAVAAALIAGENCQMNLEVKRFKWMR